jgi:hypothetical protein
MTQIILKDWAFKIVEKTGIVPTQEEIIAKE